MRAAFYGRYSTDNQNELSVEDQERLCRGLAKNLGYEVVQTYADPAMSAASRFRPQYLAMLEAAKRQEFDVLVSECLDRLSRDQEDTAHLFKTLSFAGVRIVTVSEGDVNELHIGLKGTMNALFLKDLAQKTHRGMQGRALAGKSAGGISYGYRPVHQMNPNGDVTRGDRRIEPTEAAAVRRIFQMFADGDSPITIAKTLNAEGVFGPQGRAWRDTTIRGHAERGTGILRNELYIGRQVWNRMQFRKDPATGKRVSRMNASDARVIHDIPELRIVDDAVWEQVQARLAGIREASGANAPDRNRFWESRLAQHLLTGKIFCGSCGGAFAAVGKDSLACGAARRQGTCGNRAGIRRSVLDDLILDALRTQLMQPEDVAAFVSEFTLEWNKRQSEVSATNGVRERELETVNRKLAGLIDSIAEGLRIPGVQQKLDALEARRVELTRQITETAKPAPALHPNLAEVYRQKVADLAAALHDPKDGTAAREAIRGLIDRVILHPTSDARVLEIELVGAIASLVSLGLHKQNARATTDDPGLFARSIKVVAGTRFELMTFRL